MSSVVTNADPHDHDGGFFLRLSTGLGFDYTRHQLDSSSSESRTDSRTISSDNIAIGGVLGSNLALHASLLSWSRLSNSLDIGGVGGGATYYFMPANVYVSASLGLASNRQNEDGIGLILDLTLGKEWWTSDRWAIGAAIATGFHDIVDNSQHVEKGWIAVLRFSATLN